MPKQNLFNNLSNNSLNTPPLTIYKASAGSGKTHTIIEQFLLLILDPKRKDNYKNILAVTFTKKATEEMKSRIISELAKLAKGEKSDYTNKICSTYKLDSKDLKNNSKSLLERILHDYSSFSISTIDSFFQKILRTFTQDIGMVDDFEVELDNNFVISRGIDLMLDNLEKDSDNQLIKWLVKFSLDNIEEGKKWDRKEEIEKLSEEINKEIFKQNREKILESIKDKNKLKEYNKVLNSIVNGFLDKIVEFSSKFCTLLTSNDLRFNQLKGGSRTSFNYIDKFSKRNFKDISKGINTLRKINSGDENNWITKDARKKDQPTSLKIESIYNDGKKNISDLIEYYDSNKKEYFTAKVILKNLYAIGILGDVALSMENFIRENDIILISDTTEILNKIIEDVDTPFLYERVGEFINHFMIDEFQDTSGMQWQNFKPLLDNSIAGGHANFVVGDIKQSIYRWRNSDWTLLDSQINKDFKAQGIETKNLEMNWRSAPQIIKFNNSLFSEASKILQEKFNQNEIIKQNNQTDKIEKIFEDIEQKIPQNNVSKNGLVKFQFIEKIKGETSEDVKEKREKLLIEELKKLQDNDIRLNEIAILVRDNRQAIDIVNFLLDYKNKNQDSRYKFDIISNESLYIGASPIIKLVISLLNYLVNTSNESMKMFAACELIKHTEDLRDEDADQKALERYFNNYEFPKYFMEKLEQVQKLPLYELTESLFEIFNIHLEINDQIYIQSFMDIVLEYSERYGGDLQLFLKWWKDSGSKKRLPLPEDQEAIQITTIHKSKGLGFGVVIIPSCEWNLNDYKSMIWVKSEIKPFDTIPLLPVKYKQDLSETIFSDYHDEEYLKEYIDNLNLLYVAFTRAKKALICFAKYSDEEEDNVSLLVNKTISSEYIPSENGILLKDYFDPDSKCFQFGNYDLLETTEKRNNTYEVENKIFKSIPIDDRLRLKIKNVGFRTESGQREYGLLMHDILGHIYSIKDLEPTINLYVEKGIIDKDEKKILIQILLNFMQKDLINKWFDGSFKILNERDIIMPDGKLFRPDRVMVSDSEIIVIDYKFGDSENNKYINQIKTYISIIKEMNNKRVKGYLCYITLDKTIEIC